MANSPGLLGEAEQLQLEVLLLQGAEWYPEEAESVVHWAVERRPPRLRRIILHRYATQQPPYVLPVDIELPKTLQIEFLYADSVSWDDACDRLRGS